MLKKLFNRKMLIVYIVILCLTFVSGTVSAGFAFSYSAKYTREMEKAEKSETDSSGLDSTKQAALEVILNALSVANGNSITSDKASVTPTKKAKEFKSAKNDSVTATVILYTFSALSLAGIITSVEYEKYLNSEKYRAKLKRMKRYENRH